MYNITGWSNGGRRPLSYNLMPGQFRNTRVNVFSNPTIINNNIGGFGGCYDYYDDCCCGGSNKMSWMDWTMMGGMLLNGLGNMFACFWGGGGGDAEKAKADTPDDKTLKTQAKELAEVYGVDKKNVSVIDGTIRVNINGQVIKCEDLEELEEALNGGNNDAGAATGLTDDIKNYLRELGITIDNGKFKFGDQEYDTWTAAAQAARTPATTVVNPTADEATAPTGLGTDWNGKEFTTGKFNIQSIIDKATGGDITIDTNNYNTTFGAVATGTGIPETITLTDKNDSNKKYVFKLVTNYKYYLDGNNNGNIRYACIETPTGALEADQQQQFNLKPDGTFTQEGLANWQGSEHALNFTRGSRQTHAGEGYRENTYTKNFTNLFPTGSYTHVRVPRQMTNYTSTFRVGLTLDEVLAACGISQPTQQMREAFLQMNQDAFDMTGTLVKPEDLDVYMTNEKKTALGIS